VYLREGRTGFARVLAWLLLVVYVLALAVYTFTAGHYLGHALGVSRFVIVLIEIGLVGLLVILNLLHVQHPARVQIGAVWAELSILAALAAVGFWHWRPENLSAGVTNGSVTGVLVATASTFIAFEGFEMLAYDLRELRRPGRTMRRGLPLAVLAVAAAYIVVTLGAASLVGAAALVEQRENALAAAGYAAAGTIGLIVVTIAAVASATSAINATLFSAARLARTSAEHELLPRWCARCNRYDAPGLSILLIAVGALAVTAVIDLDTLVATASLGFLSLFCLVNVVAARSRTRRRWISVAGAAGSALAAIIVIATLAR
jgi:amino acid transporter